MRKLTVTKEENTFYIYSEDKLFADIKFRNITDAEFKIENNIYEAVQDENKDIVLNENGKSLFTFKFDKLWGGAEIINSKSKTNLEIKGRWFKVGTRLIDEKDNDIVVVINGNNGFEVTVNDNDVDSLMITSTIYYHIYATRGKLLSLIA